MPARGRGGWGPNGLTAHSYRRRQLRRLSLLVAVLAIAGARLGAPTVVSAQSTVLNPVPFLGSILAPADPALANPTITSTADPQVAQITNTARNVAIVSGGNNPTGTVTFQLFSDAACTVQLFLSTNPLVADTGTNRRATSNPFNLPTAGTFHWVATYNGDANNNPAGPTACANPAAQVTVAKASTVIGTSAEPRNAVVGDPLRDRASITGGFNPTGTVTFQLFSDVACTVQVFTTTDPLDPVTRTSLSSPFPAPAPGTYHWVATYNGDANNNPTGPGPCSNLNEQVVVTGGGTTTSSSTTSSSSSTTSSSTTSTTPSSTTSTSTTVPSSTTTSSSTTSTSTPGSTTSSSSTTTSIPPSTSTSTSTSTPPSTTSSTTPVSTSTSTSTSTSIPSSTSTSTTSSSVPPSSSTSSTSSTSSSTSSSSTSTSSTVPTGTTSSTTASTSTSTTAPSTTTTVATQGTTTTLAPTPPSVQVSPQVVAPGGQATVTGAGFPPVMPVSVELFSDPVLLANVLADASGLFRAVVIIPLDTRLGAHSIVASGPGGVPTVSVQLTVARAGLIPGLANLVGSLFAQPIGANTLARTGDEVTQAARLATLLLAAGGALVSLAWQSEVARRRRPRPLRPRRRWQY